MDIKINDSGDLIIENNDLVLLTGIEAIRQDITTRLRCWRGEAFIDSTIGIDYSGVIFRKGTNKVTMDSHIKNEIMKVQGVLSVSGLVSRFEAGRVLAVSIEEIATVDGNFKYIMEI